MRQTPWAAGAQLGLTGTVWASSTTVTLTILVLVDAFDHYLSTESALVPPTSSGESLAPEPRAAVGVDAMRCAELIPTSWARAASPARRWNSAPDAAPAECAGLPTSLAPGRGAARGHRSDAGALADHLERVRARGARPSPRRAPARARPITRTTPPLRAPPLVSPRRPRARRALPGRGSSGAAARHVRLRAPSRRAAFSLLRRASRGGRPCLPGMAMGPTGGHTAMQSAPAQYGLCGARARRLRGERADTGDFDAASQQPSQHWSCR